MQSGCYRQEKITLQNKPFHLMGKCIEPVPFEFMTRDFFTISENVHKNLSVIGKDSSWKNMQIFDQPMQLNFDFRFLPTYFHVVNIFKGIITQPENQSKKHIWHLKAMYCEFSCEHLNICKFLLTCFCWQNCCSSKKIYIHKPRRTFDYQLHDPKI